MSRGKRTVEVRDELWMPRTRVARKLAPLLAGMIPATGYACHFHPSASKSSYPPETPVPVTGTPRRAQKWNRAVPPDRTSVRPIHSITQTVTSGSNNHGPS